MNQNALVRQLDLSVEKPSLSDTASDWERLGRALRSTLNDQPLEATLTALRNLGPALRRGEWNVAATVADTGTTWRVLAVEQVKQNKQAFALAIDLGTTTIVGELLNMATGVVVASELAYNVQRCFGNDVTSRMMHAEKPGGLEELRQKALATLNGLIATLCLQVHIEPGEIAGVVVAGNTIMMHLLLGFDPSTIRREPYVPVTTVFPLLDAAKVGLDVNPDAPVYLFPAASGYVGGDVVAGLLANPMVDDDELSILIDIGTNGETVLGNRDLLLACSGSAGSAFEGCGLEWGMPAQPGAIDQVWVDHGRLAFHTGGNASPRGICGSGLIEALDSLLLAGAINRGGQVNLDSPVTINGETHPEVVIAQAGDTSDGRAITLRQADIENLIRDKAALYAGSRILLANMGMTFGDVSSISIAGNFGQSLNVDHAVRIGLLPDIPRERIKFIGNSSLAGARKALLSSSAWRRAMQIASSITCLELTTESAYFDEYTAALFLPHTDLSQFPSVATLDKRIQ
jgi:uncharacterized 2Fe-2S/4Fe-4S cluster protein (DUF4445 family)